MSKVWHLLYRRFVSYRQEQLLWSSVKRFQRWEFWPMWFFYIPVVFYIVLLTLRFRGLTFTAVNPGLPGSGFIGENKSLSLLQLQQQSSRFVARTGLVNGTHELSLQIAYCHDFIADNKLSYPIIAKPDSGQRGIDVAIIYNESELQQYLRYAKCDTVVQEYIGGVEFGVFYIRHPDQTRGSIFSLTHKCFPTIVGDGYSNIETLIYQHPRLHYMAAFLLSEHQQYLNKVPLKDEVVKLVTLGSHCRGSLFLDGEDYYSEALRSSIDTVSQQLPGFYFGRYDIRAESIDAFQQGNIKVIEVNGVTSESTNMYDPKNSLFTAYGILFKQWYLAFLIGQKNRHLGYAGMGISDLISKIKIMNRGV